MSGDVSETTSAPVGRIPSERKKEREREEGAEVHSRQYGRDWEKRIKCINKGQGGRFLMGFSKQLLRGFGDYKTRKLLLVTTITDSCYGGNHKLLLKLFFF